MPLIFTFKLYTFKELFVFISLAVIKIYIISIIPMSTNFCGGEIFPQKIFKFMMKLTNINSE